MVVMQLYSTGFFLQLLKANWPINSSILHNTQRAQRKKITIRKVTRMWDKIVLLVHRIKHPILNLRILTLFMKMSLFIIRICIVYSLLWTHASIRMWDKIVLLVYQIKHPILNLRIVNLFPKISLFIIKIGILFILYFETLCTAVNQNLR